MRKEVRQINGFNEGAFNKFQIDFLNNRIEKKCLFLEIYAFPGYHVDTMELICANIDHFTRIIGLSPKYTYKEISHLINKSDNTGKYRIEYSPVLSAIRQMAFMYGFGHRDDYRKVLNDHRYTREQMIKLITGMIEDIDISRYSNYSYNGKIMDILFKYLKNIKSDVPDAQDKMLKFINLALKRYNDGTLMYDINQITVINILVDNLDHFKRNNIDIENILNPNLNFESIHIIINSMINDIDITPYLSKYNDPDLLKIVRDCVKNNYPVTFSPEFSYYHAKEYYRGLSLGIDNSVMEKINSNKYPSEVITKLVDHFIWANHNGKIDERLFNLERNWTMLTPLIKVIEAGKEIDILYPYRHNGYYFNKLCEMHIEGKDLSKILTNDNRDKIYVKILLSNYGLESLSEEVDKISDSEIGLVKELLIHMQSRKNISFILDYVNNKDLYNRDKFKLIGKVILAIQNAKNISSKIYLIEDILSMSYDQLKDIYFSITGDIEYYK